MDTSSILNFIISLVGGVSAALLTVSYLSKKIIESRLKKDFELFKAELNSKIYINQSRILSLKEKEYDILCNLWEYITEIECIIHKFKRNDECVNELEIALDKMSDFVNSKEPFIDNDVVDIVNLLLSNTSPDSFSDETHKAFCSFKVSLINAIKCSINHI